MYDTTRHFINDGHERHRFYITHDMDEQIIFITCLDTSYSDYIELNENVEQQINNLRKHNFLSSLFHFNDEAKEQLIKEVQIRIDETR